MANHQISVFSAFSLQMGSNAGQQLQSQWILWYAESRFRQALLVIHKATERDQGWMQCTLRDELVSGIFT